MNLDQVVDKEKMSSVYKAYLENTPGSKKALEELLEKNVLPKESERKEEMHAPRRSGLSLASSSPASRATGVPWPGSCLPSA